MCSKEFFFLSFTWGSAEHGKLGHIPKKVEASGKSNYNTRASFDNNALPEKVLGVLQGKIVKQVQCGEHHTVRRRKEKKQ